MDSFGPCWRAMIGVALAVALLLLGPAEAGATGGPAPAREATPFGSPVAWTDCGPPAGLQCARIEVPLDWDRPGGRKIRLAVIRHLASRPEHRIGTLFASPGGPGESGVSMVRGDPAGFDAWGAGRFDVVGWDPRGTNRSTRVRCFRSQKAETRFWAGVSIPTSIPASKHYRRKAAGLARRCGRVSGWLLPHVTTANSARDLDYLRRLVGERQLTFAGLSYGTFLGQTYANMFPDRVRAMMLDSISDPIAHSRGAEARIAVGVAPSDEVFARFLAECESAGPGRCALAGGSRSPAERVDRLFARVKRAPIPAPTASLLGQTRGKLSYADLLLSQFSPMRGPSTWPQDARDLEAALEGNGSALETVARAFSGPDIWAAASTSSAIACADAPARRALRSWPQVIGRLNGISRMQGRILGWWLWAPCAAWSVRGQDAYRGPWTATTPNPILLINNRFDPNTGYANAVRVEHLLGNAVLLTNDGYGHLSYQDPSKCVEEARVDYLVHLITPPPGTVCQPDQQPFDPGFG